MILSIITVNFNGKEGLARTLGSVLPLPEGLAESIVIDGGSTDNSLELIRSQAANLAYWVSEPDQGIYDAMNKGLAKAQGQYVMFLNGGDMLASPAVLTRCLEELARHPTTDVLYGHVVLTEATQPNHPLGQWRYPAKLNLAFFRHQTLNHQASLIRRSLFERVGPYPLQYRLAADYWLYLTAILQSCQFRLLDMPLVCYDRTGRSATDNFAYYKTEMAAIWQELVPTFAQDLVAENLRLHHLTEARLVRLAAAGNSWLRKLVRR